jgi:hypothetical protein
MGTVVMPKNVPVYICPHCKTQIPFGTETKHPPGRCPGCKARLYIPTTLQSFRMLPPANVSCPACGHCFAVERFTSKNITSLARRPCPVCGAAVKVPDGDHPDAQS